MEAKKNQEVITLPEERIEARIFVIRGKKVMLDRDLAVLYGVETKVLNQAVRRHAERFPEDFMFTLSQEEMQNWRSQIVTSIAEPGQVWGRASRSQFVTLNRGKNIKYAPCAFTEQGIAMLSSVLNSPRAIKINIQIIRTFTKLREMIVSNAELRKRLDVLEQKYDARFQAVFQAIHGLLDDGNIETTEIGFKQ